MEGRYTFSILSDDQTDRIIKLALPNNSAVRLAIVNVPEGTTIFTGEVAPQLTFSPGLVEGGQQIFLTGPLEQFTFEEVMMPRQLLDGGLTYGH